MFGRLWCVALLVTSFHFFRGEDTQAETYQLKDQDYKEMLGDKAPLFKKAVEFSQNLVRNNSIMTINEQLIRDQFSFANIIEVKKYDVQSHSVMTFESEKGEVTQFHTRYGGWIITINETPTLKIGIQARLEDNGDARDMNLVFGYSDSTDDAEWFKRKWFSPQTLFPFQTLMLVAIDEHTNYYNLRFDGAQFDSQKRVVREFTRYFNDSPILWMDVNPPRKLLADTEKRTLVAILDSGVDYNHPDLASKLVLPFNSDELSTWKSRLQKINSEITQYQSAWNSWWHDDDIEKLQREASSVEKIFQSQGQGWDFAEQDALPFDHGRAILGASVSHGTAVASLAGGDGSIAVLPIRILGSSLSDHEINLTSEVFEDAFIYGYERGARIFSMSFGGPLIDDYRTVPGLRDAKVQDIMALQEADTKLRQQGEKIQQIANDHLDVLFIFAAGNQTSNSLLLDADKQLYSGEEVQGPNVIHVASHNAKKELSTFSVYGKNTVETAAFGDLEVLPFAGGKHFEAAGTSFAAPRVAFIAAKIRDLHPDFSIEKIVKILKDSAVHTPEMETKLKWGGYIDLNAALKKANETR